MPRKRSAGGNGNMSGATPACRIKINAAGDWQVVPPAGQITQIGNAGATSRGLVANADLFVSGKLETDGPLYCDNRLTVVSGIDGSGDSNIASGGSCTIDVLTCASLTLGSTMYKQPGDNNSELYHYEVSEEVTIPVGQGAAGINSVGDLAYEETIIKAVAVRVTQAPGGGATVVHVGRTGGNIDEFIQNLAVALGTTGNSAANGDGVNAGPVHNAASNTFVITTDANVTGAAMKIRICVWSIKINAPDS